MQRRRSRLAVGELAGLAHGEVGVLAAAAYWASGRAWFLSFRGVAKLVTIEALGGVGSVTVEAAITVRHTPRVGIVDNTVVAGGWVQFKGTIIRSVRDRAKTRTN